MQIRRPVCQVFANKRCLIIMLIADFGPISYAAGYGFAIILEDSIVYCYKLQLNININYN